MVSSFYSMFTQVPKTFTSAVAVQEVSWSVDAGFSLSQFCSVSSCRSRQTDDDQITQKYHWIITINS